MTIVSETKQIPAPIDEKNITTDWIEYIFDSGCTNGGPKDKWYVGFVDSYIASARIINNKLIWRLHKATVGFVSWQDALAALLKRLKDYDKSCDEAGSNVYCEYKVEEDSTTIVQKFYFKQEDYD